MTGRMTIRDMIEKQRQDAAAIVLKEGMTTDERAVRDYAATRLTGFTVPRRILIVAEIPKGATGRLQRIGLAQKLGLA
ncbi:hypothetical protein BH10PSE7_BH10PSE7_07670 [soil metagenome]